MTGKKKMILILGAVFTLTTVSLSTFAYMSDKKQVVNYLEFIGEEGMAASLQEPSGKRASDSSGYDSGKRPTGNQYIRYGYG